MSKPAKGTRKKVVGIIPAEVSKGFVTGEIEQESVEVSFSKKDNSEFDKIRENLILSAFGLTKDEYKEFIETYNKIKDGGGVTEASQTDILRDKRNVFIGQAGSNKKDSKEVVIETAKTAGTIFIGTFIAKISEVLSTMVPGLPFILGVAGIAIILKKYLKARKGNVSDATEKQRDYELFLMGFVENVQKLTDSIEKDKVMILDMKKTMSKKEFNKFINGYLKGKVKELGLEEFVSLDTAIINQQEEKLKNEQIEQVENNKNSKLDVQFGGA